MMRLLSSCTIFTLILFTIGDCVKSNPSEKRILDVPRAGSEAEIPSPFPTLSNTTNSSVPSITPGNTTLFPSLSPTLAPSVGNTSNYTTHPSICDSDRFAESSSSGSNIILFNAPSESLPLLQHYNGKGRKLMMSLLAG